MTFYNSRCHHAQVFGRDITFLKCFERFFGRAHQVIKRFERGLAAIAAKNVFLKPNCKGGIIYLDNF